MIYCLMFVIVFLSSLVVSAQNAVVSVLALILVFFFSSVFLVSKGVYMLAYLFVIVYVGAVAVLFLFVIMMLNLTDHYNVLYSKDGKFYKFVMFFSFFFLVFMLLVVFYNVLHVSFFYFLNVWFFKFIFGVICFDSGFFFLNTSPLVDPLCFDNKCQLSCWFYDKFVVNNFFLGEVSIGAMPFGFYLLEAFIFYIFLFTCCSVWYEQHNPDSLSIVGYFKPMGFCEKGCEQGVFSELLEIFMVRVMLECSPPTTHSFSHQMDSVGYCSVFNYVLDGFFRDRILNFFSGGLAPRIDGSSNFFGHLSFDNLFFFEVAEWLDVLLYEQDIHVIGSLLYTKFFLSFLLSSLVLLLAMIGAIVLTTRSPGVKQSFGVKKQSIFEQVSTVQNICVVSNAVEKGEVFGNVKK